MPTSRHWFSAFAWLVLTAGACTAPAYANQLVYVPLAQPCRLLDTRAATGGPGPLTAAHGAYLFGAFDADIQSAAQHGSATGCGIRADVEAVSVNMNLLDTTASGNITTWSAGAGTTAPNIGTAVYNPTVASAAPGQVQYNTGYTNVPLGFASGSPGRFYLQVANGQVDMTINLVGYWLPISWGENRSASYAIALGVNTTASGIDSTAMGEGTLAGGVYATAMGYQTIASGYDSTAMGYATSAPGDYSMAMGWYTTGSGTVSTAMGVNTTASGYSSIAMGELTNASDSNSTAMGYKTSADGGYSIAMGSNVGSGRHTGSFIYGDHSRSTGIVNSADNEFMAIADGGFVLVTSASGATGAVLAHGSGSWAVLSDRNAKTAVQPVDPRDVLKKVTSLPLNTWQYKAQDAKYRHMGPMAQDFYAAFQLGESDKSIDTVDADGVALAAIQGLNALLAEKDAKTVEKLEEKDREIAALRTELTTRVAALESTATDLNEMKAQLAALRKFMQAEMTVALQQPQ